MNIRHVHPYVQDRLRIRAASPRRTLADVLWCYVQLEDTVRELAAQGEPCCVRLLRAVALDSVPEVPDPRGENP